MKYLRDTDRAADYLKGRADAVELLRTLAGDGIGMSLVTYGELWEGVAYGREPVQNAPELRAFLRLVDPIALNQGIMRRFATIRGRLRRRGQLIGDFDTLIAATAVHYDLVLVTRNLRHFDRIPDVQVHESARAQNRG